MPDTSCFPPDLFDFLRDLAENNDRDWFKAHKARYDASVKEPALAFIRAFAPILEEISPHFRADARAVGGSLFRIQRDTRFSKDKRPYKSNTGLHFRHGAGKDVHAPGFYLHLAPDEIFAGVGIWHPPTPTLTKIRNKIVAEGDRWTAMLGEQGYSLGGDSLKRAPKGFAPDHPMIEDLRRKDFIVGFELTEDAAETSGFMDVFADRSRQGAPLVEFLCEAVEVPF